MTDPAASPLPLWADIQHESDKELLQRYKSNTHPIGPEDLGKPRRIFRIAVDAVMKLSDTGDCEINAMTLVTTQTTIPVPSLLRVIQTDGNMPTWRYIVIRYIPAPNLEDCWSTLSWWRKVIILCTLRRYVRQFRKISNGNRPPGPIGDGPQICYGPAFSEDYGSGPFATYAEMSAWFARRLVVSHRFKRANPNAAPFDSSLPLVFTHFDLSPRNLLLDERNRLWVIDFQFSGFYPQWFEYTGMLHAWNRLGRSEWITEFLAGGYKKQRIFLLNVGWAVNVGHLIQ